MKAPEWEGKITTGYDYENRRPIFHVHLYRFCQERSYMYDKSFIHVVRAAWLLHKALPMVNAGKADPANSNLWIGFSNVEPDETE